MSGIQKVVSLFSMIIFFSSSSFAQDHKREFSFYSESNCAKKEARYRKWCRKRLRRDLRINAYLKNNKSEADAFLFGAPGQGTVPMVMFRVFTELFPEIWGSTDDYIKPGLTKNLYRPKSKLPLGLAVSKPLEIIIGESTKKNIGINMVGFNCTSCHTGQVVDTKGNSKILLGAPNTRIDGMLFKVAQTSVLKSFTAKNFRKALKAKGSDWKVYGDPAMGEVGKKELALFLEKGVAEDWVKRVKTQGGKLLGAFNHFIKPRIYGAPGVNNVDEPLAPKRGLQNAFFATFLAFVGETMALAQNQSEDERAAWIKKELDSVIPTTPADTDNPSIWSQRTRGNHSHWGGELGTLLNRNLATAAATLNKPISFDNMYKVTEFINDLPPAAYPFDVDEIRRKRGRALFVQNCASCHGKISKVYDAKAVGTDINRIQHLNMKSISFLRPRLIAYCVDNTPTPEKYCMAPDGSVPPPDYFIRKTTGYVSDRLDGLWARAPYLHNGSVPTLEHLLLPKTRPIKFYRGALTYDREKVGFDWESDVQDMTVLYDTEKSGQSRLGHDSIEYLGIDWSKNEEKRKDLLEYLKAL